MRPKVVPVAQEVVVGHEPLHRPPDHVNVHRTLTEAQSVQERSQVSRTRSCQTYGQVTDDSGSLKCNDHYREWPQQLHAVRVNYEMIEPRHDTIE